MLRFYADSFAQVMSAISEVSASIRTAKLRGHEDIQADREYAHNLLTIISGEIEKLPLSPVVKAQSRRLDEKINTATAEVISELLHELHENILVDLSQSIFLSIHFGKREFFEQTKEPFGEKVSNIFPDAKLDISAAYRCYALDEWTACVFHLMRALEHGLRWLSLEVGLSQDGIRLENWKNIIDRIEKKIRELEQEKKTEDKNRKLQQWSESAAQFRYFKDAWRNHVNHSRKSYDEREADIIRIHVKAFMEHLAKISDL